MEILRFSANATTSAHDSHLHILALFLHPSPPSQWLVRAPLVIMLPQLTHGLPLPYGCNNSIVRSHKSRSLFKASRPRQS